MRSGELKRSSPMRRRRRLKSTSDKRRAQLVGRSEIREAVFRRDGHRCRMQQLDPEAVCFGPLTPHHVRKAGQGGLYTMENLITLCAFHNDWCEDYPLLAHALGLVKRAGEV